MNWEKIKEWMRHNQFVATALVACVIVLVWVYGCESKVKSPFDPSEMVTRAELVNQIDYINAQIGLAFKELDKQDVFKQKLFEIGVAVAEGGTINPVGVGVSLLGVLGLGAVADNRKKNAVIKTLQNGSSNGTTTPTVSA